MSELYPLPKHVPLLIALTDWMNADSETYSGGWSLPYLQLCGYVQDRVHQCRSPRQESRDAAGSAT